MFDISNLRKTYPEAQKPCLNGVNLSIGEREFITLRGPSGSGKSTLLHAIGGIESYDSGDIRFHGKNFKDFTKYNWIDFRRFQIGLIFQFFHLFPRLSVIENVLLPARISQIVDSKKIDRALSLIELVGLIDYKNQDVGKLSGGEKQRVALARALINEPKIILADEPTGNLDSKTTRNILDLFKKIHETEQTSFLIVTHDEHVFKIGRRRLQILDGQIDE